MAKPESKFGRDPLDFALDGKSLRSILGKSSLIPKEPVIRGVMDSGAVVAPMGSRRIFCKVIVDFKGEFRLGTWIRTSRVLKTVSLPHHGKDWWFVETKNANYVIQMQEGVDPNAQQLQQS